MYLLLRLPSLWEPHWYTDEAGYVTTAQTMLGGKVLYSQIWTNKPPLQIWTIAVVTRLFGTAELTLHLLTFASGALTLAAVAYAAWRPMGPRRTLVALGLAAVLLGGPFLDAELALPESLLIAPATWAGAILVRRLEVGVPPGPPEPGPGAGRVEWWAIVVGALTAAAIAYQQTAVAGAAALGLALLLSGRLRALWQFAVTALGITAAWLAVALVIAGPSHVAFALVGFYVSFTEAVQPTSAGGTLQHALLLAAALVLVIGGAWGCRRRRASLWVYWLWAGAMLLVPAVAHQPYAHYLLPAAPPVALALASVPLPGRHRSSPGRYRSQGELGTRALSRGGLVALAAGVVLAAAGARVAGVDWVLPHAGTQGGIADYYGGSLRVLTGQQTLRAWQDAFDPRVAADRGAARWITSHGFGGARAVVWSSDAWPYALAHLPVLLPTPPIYNDEVLLGEGGPVATRVASLRPTLVITTEDAIRLYPEIEPVLRRDYRSVFRSGPETVYLRDGVALSRSG